MRMKFQYGMGMSIVDTFPRFLPVAGGFFEPHCECLLHYPVVCPRTCASNPGIIHLVDCKLGGSQLNFVVQETALLYDYPSIG